MGLVAGGGAEVGGTEGGADDGYNLVLGMV